MAFARVSIASSSTSSTASRAPVSVASRSRAFHARGGVAQTLYLIQISDPKTHLSVDLKTAKP